MGTFDRDERRRSRSRACGGPVRPVFEHSHFGSEKPDYKTAALCKQVMRAVSLALAGECGDPALQSLVVHDVLPAPNAGRLLVRLLAPAVHDYTGIVDLLERLEKIRGLLRARIAESIARKRTPELSFDILPTGAAPSEVQDGE